MDKPVADQIEAMIDEHGLLHVLTAIECICSEKAEHIRSNWQDCITARSWDKASQVASTAARHIPTNI